MRERWRFILLATDVVGRFVLLPLAGTYAALWLIGDFFDYYDIGINRAANSLSLLFLYLPLFLFTLLAVNTLLAVGAQRWRLSRGVVFAATTVLTACAVVLGFLVVVYEHKDYPSERPITLGEFVHHQLGSPAEISH